MLAFIKLRQFIFALMLCGALVLLLSYFSLGRNRKNNLPLSPATRSPATSESPSAHDLPHFVSLDSDNDGIPDAAELQSFADRENFRRWFTLIAEGQFYHLSDQWNAEQRDCAGLVRFAWREALRRHDRLWFQKMGPGYTPIAPDVAHYNLEQGPLGEKLFRTNFGAYKEGELVNGTFSEFADARTLKSFNTKFISRDRHYAQPGDLLFFYQPWVQKFPYHVMIFLGTAKLTGEQAADWVVYHTGSSPTDQGTVKKVELSVLDHHPNKRWRPVESNPNFLGFYRLKILD
ncbi:MAG TPA: DUF1175 domain-containing protein [Blastocatellia bacterium]|jgi:uncharacterized protein YfaT (DUF1175 family)|nr:DUF1175 domain-containing protein [Blastocatellia bacterium]HAF23450.1 DUF1175 domain-containing protein [Blastocatellia bacterium]HCX30850.1 DUF1175 domain-containing protein [Blastocatellia bacterium]